MEEIISFKLFVTPKIQSIELRDVNQTAHEIIFECAEMNEDRFICCAQLVFDSAINKENSSIKCAKFFKVFSDQTAISYVGPVTFKDVVRNISQEHFDLIKNDQASKEKCLLILRFLANLYRVEMLSSEIILSWKASLNKLSNDDIASNNFQWRLNLTKLEEYKTDQKITHSSSVKQSKYEIL